MVCVGTLFPTLNNVNAKEMVKKAKCMWVIHTNFALKYLKRAPALRADTHYFFVRGTLYVASDKK